MEVLGAFLNGEAGPIEIRFDGQHSQIIEELRRYHDIARRTLNHGDPILNDFYHSMMAGDNFYTYSMRIGNNVATIATDRMETIKRVRLALLNIINHGLGSNVDPWKHEILSHRENLLETNRKVGELEENIKKNKFPHLSCIHCLSQ